jgi:hypothetical protein
LVNEIHVLVNCCFENLVFSSASLFKPKNHISINHELPREYLKRYYENPKALIFKGTHTGTLTAYICGQCGYTEMYIVVFHSPSAIKD